jgi:hypothetical protein
MKREKGLFPFSCAFQNISDVYPPHRTESLTYSEDWIFTMPPAAQPAGSRPNTAVWDFGKRHPHFGVRLAAVARMGSLEQARDLCTRPTTQMSAPSSSRAPTLRFILF